MNSPNVPHESNYHDETAPAIQSDFLHLAAQRRKIREETHNLNEVKDQRGFRYFQLSLLKNQRLQIKETHQMLVEKFEVCVKHSREREQDVKSLESRMGSSRIARSRDTSTLNEAYKELRTAQQHVFRAEHDVTDSSQSIENNTKDISTIEHYITVATEDITTLEQRLWDLEAEAKDTKDRTNAMKRMEQTWQGEGSQELIAWVRASPALFDKVFNLQEMVRFAKWLPNVRQAILLLNHEIITHIAGERQGGSGQGRHRALYPQVLKNAIDSMKRLSRQRKPEDAERDVLDGLISGLQVIDDFQLKLYGLHYASCGMLERNGSEA